jgi:Uri superfamily endonuclease
LNYDHEAFFSNILLLKTYAVLPFGSSDCQAKTVMLRVPDHLDEVASGRVKVAKIGLTEASLKHDNVQFEDAKR